MKQKILFVCGLSVVLLCGCKQQGRTLPSATGSIYEALIVMDNQAWQGAAGDSVRKYLAADMPCLPQMEPYFTLSQVSPALFDNLFKPTRNILIADINAEKYTKNKIVYAENVFSRPQALCRIQSPSEEAFLACIGEYGNRIQHYFVRQELLRQASFYRSYTNTNVREAVQKHFGCDILIPSDYQLVADSADFVWAVNDKGSLRRDILVWSYPYTNPATFSLDYLLAKRDSIMKVHVAGIADGSYAGTEYKHIVPQFNEISVQKNAYCAEVRGLWKMYGGASMGGPFVQHTRLDEINQRIVTAEVFVFAPGQKKRNALRQAEAILYTLRLPQELNNLQEVQVTQ
ncbi:MAG: DUF4837 family protein [Paludibacter sp.]|nr:DUF4837 family protein [Bacteroidales bacterium]MCM1068927.1 DUF4837 family protein [Prevotella sp.]MCM1353188.1 DUF4837 family protein [Bacteroides sp.]MCM1442510.1 DUF4837 family protein [Muribaculum sp.]MCM1481353.1 DUF4837 family protein [Paludibacter sp.]